MMKLMIDTSAYAAFKRGHAAAVAPIRSAAQILMPVTVLGELLAGFESGSRRESNRTELAAFLNSPRVQSAPVGETTAECYARIYAYLREQGRPIPTNDLWIAALAMEHGAPLLTADAHFSQVPHILLERISADPG